MGRITGVVTGQVTNNVDPDGQGRVLVSFPFMGGQNQSYWAPIATLMSGGNRGSWFMPEVGDEVLVSFNQEDSSHPYIIGFLWNGQDTPPSTDTHLRTIRSVNGHEIQLYDPPLSGGDQGYIRIQYARGGGATNKVEINNTEIAIESDSAVTIQAPMVTINGGETSKVVVNNVAIAIESDSAVTIQAPAVTISSGANNVAISSAAIAIESGSAVTIQAPAVTINGRIVLPTPTPI